jgi:hypothetical protein
MPLRSSSSKVSAVSRSTATVTAEYGFFCRDRMREHGILGLKAFQPLWSHLTALLVRGKHRGSLTEENIADG